MRGDARVFNIEHNMSETTTNKKRYESNITYLFQWKRKRVHEGAQ